MLNLFKKKHLDKQNTHNTTQNIRYDFVDRYVLVDPKHVLLDYAMFNQCTEIPVACENTGPNSQGFNNCVLLPNKKPFSHLLYQLKVSDSKTIQNPIYRTVSVINVALNKRIFILPDIEHIKKPICVVDFDTKNPNDWVLYVNPTINRAIVEQAKMFTRFESR